MKKLIRNRKGQGLVEYALIIAGVALIGIVGISMFGHKVADLIGTVAAILPGAHTDDQGPIVAGHLIETTQVQTETGTAIGINTSATGGALDQANTINNNTLGVPGNSVIVQETPGG